jgi:hypothetical protein
VVFVLIGRNHPYTRRCMTTVVCPVVQLVARLLDGSDVTGSLDVPAKRQGGGALGIGGCLLPDHGSQNQ